MSDDNGESTVEVLELDGNFLEDDLLAGEEGA
jgi:hypothetical protein